jgi:hypothetical protein
MLICETGVDARKVHKTLKLLSYWKSAASTGFAEGLMQARGGAIVC